VGYVLLTNDDGVDSPALLPFVRALSEVAEVRAVVPDRERSWIGKAITRFGTIRVQRVVKEGIEVAVADGFPADCTQLGVHSLFGARPDMVVSGINIGLNDSLAFFLSSGTVGAAVEGWIAGIPALAISTGVTRDHPAWARRVWAGDEEDLWPRAGRVGADIVRSVMSDGYPSGVDLLNVNFDTNATTATPRVVTDLAKVGYDKVFREVEPGVFVHDFSSGLRIEGDLSGTDVEAVAKGLVSITQVRLAHASPMERQEW
jgi:5'-nucleotidase